jgi:hypothetical protein
MGMAPQRNHNRHVASGRDWRRGAPWTGPGLRFSGPAAGQAINRGAGRAVTANRSELATSARPMS